MNATRTYKFITKAYGTITIRAYTFDEALEAFLQEGYQESDIIEVC